MKRLAVSLILLMSFCAAWADSPLVPDVPKDFFPGEISIGAGPVFGEIGGLKDAGYFMNRYTAKGSGVQFSLQYSEAFRWKSYKSESVFLSLSALYNLMQDPRVEVDGLEDGKDSRNSTFGEFMFLTGVMYKFNPTDIYLAGRFGFGSFYFSFPASGSSGYTDLGISLQAEAGKHIRVYDNWKLGIGVSYNATLVVRGGFIGSKYSSSRYGANLSMIYELE
ncbi:MAG: hypothetical protein ACM3U1_07565 [Chloroflexota bacterium]